MAKSINSKQLVQKILNRFSDVNGLKSRSMFGGYGICYNEMMFALVSDGQLYLRATKKLKTRFTTAGMKQFIYRNRGVPVQLNYYLVDNICDLETPTFLRLSKMALIATLKESAVKKSQECSRLKDLPNIGLTTERLLSRAGILDKEMLIEQGALAAYLMVKKISSDVSQECLFALAGAIEGCHVAVLPPSTRNELLDALKKSENIISI